jgi:hypothetical protein
VTATAGGTQRLWACNKILQPTPQPGKPEEDVVGRKFCAHATFRKRTERYRRLGRAKHVLLGECILRHFKLRSVEAITMMVYSTRSLTERMVVANVDEQGMLYGAVEKHCESHSGGAETSVELQEQLQSGRKWKDKMAEEKRVNLVKNMAGIKSTSERGDRGSVVERRS